MKAGRLMAGLAWVLAATVSAAIHAQTPTETGTQFYVKYHAAFDKATSVDDILPYMSSRARKDMESKPADDRKKMFGLIKMLGSVTDLKVLKEEKTAAGATLTVEAVDFEKKKTKGTITLIRENGAWKLDGESWSS